MARRSARDRWDIPAVITTEQYTAMVQQNMSETAFQDQVVAMAKALGWLVYHTYDSRRSNKGWPDLFMVRNGRALAWELKKESGKPTPDQVEWIAQLEKVPGIMARVVYPHDWLWIVEQLEGA
jgi:hypothetical protein